MTAIKTIFYVTLILCTLPCTTSAAPHGDEFFHPIKTGHVYSQTSHCPNCGMNINMWARTRHQFTLGTTSHETCSIRCMTDLSDKAGETPSAVKTAVYLAPATMGETLNGWYVIGSKARGTMTMKSKIFFISKEKAEQFSLKHGGDLARLDVAMQKAQKELQPMRAKLQQKRLKKGKITIPDEKASCANCGMRPAAYPKYRSQMNVKGVGTVHFCSTKCMIKQKDSLAGKGSSIWVTVYPTGDTEFALGLYYVIGSDIMGPMGPDAIPFRKKEDAMVFIRQHGGEIKVFSELRPSLFGGMMHQGMH